MNIFSKILSIILGLLLGIAGVTQLQLIALELMNQADTGSFLLGLFYLAIVIFIGATIIYYTIGYLVKSIEKNEDPIDSQPEQEVSNEQKPNN
jgi:TRAP-type C4-dicarboxylate transport system permease small subunit